MTLTYSDERVRRRIVGIVIYINQLFLNAGLGLEQKAARISRAARWIDSSAMSNSTDQAIINQGALIPFTIINILSDAAIAAVLCSLLYRRRSNHKE